MQKPLKILQASAGSGKTFNLAAHYLTLLFSSENKYREILAVTFTNKATEEMKSRIMQVLRGLAEGNDSVKDYRNIIQQAYPHLTEKTIQEKADKIFRKILHDYSRFAVTTIDGFVQKVIRSFAFELGLNTEYQLEMNTAKVREELVEKMDASLDDDKQLQDWIISLALERIDDNKSWNYKSELNNLAEEIFKESFEVFENAISTFSSEDLDQLFNNFLIQTNNEIDDYEKTMDNLSEKAESIFKQFCPDKTQFVRGSMNWLFKLNAITSNDHEKLSKIFKLIDNPIAWFKPGKGDDALYNKLNPLLKKIKNYYEERVGNYELAIAFKQNLYYLRLMQELAKLLSVYREENDNLLITDAQKLITGITADTGDNPSFIWEKTGARYRNFLFDEFQDTSVNQWKSFRPLLINTLASANGKQIDNLIVGDTKQSIYRWRNGDWNILHEQAKKDLGVSFITEDSLAENYRSASKIIDFNNRLFQLLPALLQDNLNDAVDEQSDNLKDWWKKNGFDNVITSVYAGVVQEKSPVTLKGGTIKIKCISKEEGDSERFKEKIFRDKALNDMVNEIAILLNEKKYLRKDIAILVRSNTEAATCVNKLMEEKIPVISGEALLISNNAAVDLIVNTLKVITGLEEETTLYKANCVALYHRVHQKTADPANYCKLDGKTLEQLSDLLPATLCKHWQQWLQLPLAELVENIISCYQLEQLQQHIPYLLAFRDLVSIATKPGEKGIGNFLEWWEEDGASKALPSPEDADAIQIITIHKSKGLAFRAVFIPFCIWDTTTRSNSIFWVPAQNTIYHQLGSFPLKYTKALAWSAVSESYFKETLYSYMDSLNMLYVATTRARDFLYIATMQAGNNSKSTKNFSNIGHVVNHAKEQIDEEIFLEEDVNRPFRQVKENSIRLNAYPTSQRLSALYVETENKHINHLLNKEKSGRRGSLAHEVLAHASNEKEAVNYLKKLLSEGVLQEAEMKEIQQAVMEVLQHPELNSLLHEPGQSIVEKDIIDTNGYVHRPDRIIIKKDGVVLIDYKFTHEQSPRHVEQILAYKKLLSEMGYNNVQPYIFYAEKKELKMVG
ncbi:MAG: UvrD-helicase domain-containing protein [Bacteroidetes bacterium]|nr:UvrD-helicase domain-containing protein [Bacteroidota bacterium]